MVKLTRHSIQWFYELLEKGECDTIDFKEQLEDKLIFGKSYKNFAPNYKELARDVVAFSNKKGGFIIIGIVDDTKELNPEFKNEKDKIFELVRQIQDSTVPSVSIKPHQLKVNARDILVLEVPFSKQLHRMGKGEYLIRSNNGNRAIEPHEIATVQSEKELIVFDQKILKLHFESTETDKNNNAIPGWQDIEKTRNLFSRIQKEKPESPFLKTTTEEFSETLGLIKEERGIYHPTIAGILFIGKQKALKELPYNQIKYIRYFEDGTYKPYEYAGNLIDMADECFAQLKSESKQKEIHFGLNRVFVEDYSQVLLRELLINAMAHRDYSRQQIIEIRKFPTHMEFESPGQFPQGIDADNILRKTNPRNPNIMDVFREIKYAEKAGSGFDKVFRELLSNGKQMPKTIQTSTSILVKVNANVTAEKLGELSQLYKKLTNVEEIDVQVLVVLNNIYERGKLSYSQLETSPYVQRDRLKGIIKELQDLEFIETTGRTSGIKYILHRSKRLSVDDKISYSKQKQQERAEQIESIMRYLKTIDEIDNEAARKLLNIPDSNASYISRLFGEMMENNLLQIASEIGHNRRTYKIKQSLQRN